MKKEIREKLINWVMNNYNPKACGYTEKRSHGNEAKIFSDGVDYGAAMAAYDVALIIGLKPQKPEELKK